MFMNSESSELCKMYLNAIFVRKLASFSDAAVAWNTNEIYLPSHLPNMPMNILRGSRNSARILCDWECRAHFRPPKIPSGERPYTITSNLDEKPHPRVPSARDKQSDRFPSIAISHRCRSERRRHSERWKCTNSIGSLAMVSTTFYTAASMGSFPNVESPYNRRSVRQLFSRQPQEVRSR